MLWVSTDDSFSSYLSTVLAQTKGLLQMCLGWGPVCARAVMQGVGAYQDRTCTHTGCCRRHAIDWLSPEWLASGKLKQLVLVITDAETSDVLERWTFDIDTNKEVMAGGYGRGAGAISCQHLHCATYVQA